MKGTEGVPKGSGTANNKVAGGQSSSRIETPPKTQSKSPPESFGRNPGSRPAPHR